MSTPKQRTAVCEPGADSAYEARPLPIPFPAAECSPHRSNMLAAQKKQRDLFDAGRILWKAGETDAALVVYSAGEREWDDAIHISNPDDPTRSLCGSLGRNLCQFDGPPPDAWAGCWTCLTKADGRRERAC